MQEKHAIELAAGLNAITGNPEPKNCWKAWHSGGGIYLVTCWTPADKLIVISEDSICTYDDEYQYYYGGATEAIGLDADPLTGPNAESGGQRDAVREAAARLLGALDFQRTEEEDQGDWHRAQTEVDLARRELEVALSKHPGRKG